MKEFLSFNLVFFLGVPGVCETGIYWGSLKLHVFNLFSARNPDEAAKALGMSTEQFLLHGRERILM